MDKDKLNCISKLFYQTHTPSDANNKLDQIEIEKMDSRLTPLKLCYKNY